MKALLIAFVTATVLCACAQPMERAAPPEPVTAKPVDMHTSRNSLDWAGIYMGILPGAEPAGTKTRLTLNRDGTYERVTLPVGRQEAARTVRGSFAWHPGGNAIRLDEPGGGQQFAVGEGRLLLLHPGGPNAGTPVPGAVLTLAPQATTGEDIAQTLARYRWSLESATDGQNRVIEALSPRKDHPVVFEFSGTRLAVQAPCNRMMGSYRISAAKQLTVSGTASTNMACAPELMLADAALSGLLAKPLQVELDNAPIPRLRLVSASRETLTFTGRATPEALYGPGAIVFLEVAARHVACANPPPPNTRCLQVRDRRFDEQGLAVGEPGAWRTLHENIEGFTHREGERNVLRVKRFNRPAASPRASSTLYVLDLIIETQIVTP
jgi:heat shock protein HslJ